MHTSLRTFLEELKSKNLLKIITSEVSDQFEITEIQRRTILAKGPALLFENVVDKSGKKFSAPVLVNLFGTKERVALALNRKPSELKNLGHELASLRFTSPPSGIADVAKGLKSRVCGMINTRTHLVNNAPCQEIVLSGNEIDLRQLPIQTNWPEDVAPLITWGIVVTKGPAKGTAKGMAKGTEDEDVDDYNLGVYRLQLIDRDHAIMRWLPHRGGAQHFARWKKSKNGEPFPVAIIIGADPATMLAAATPLPDNVSEYDYAGLIRGKSIDFVNCLTVPLMVPSQSEIIIEGYIGAEVAEEGPYGDHTGYYNSVEKFPVMKVSAITMRKNPIYVSTFMGRPPDEPSVISEAFNDIFIPLLQQQFPEIVDFYLPPEACSYRFAIVSIKKLYAGHAKRIMMGIWSYLRQFLYTKYIVIVDEDIDVRSWPDVIWAISTRSDPVRDTVLIDNSPVDYLDFASPISNLGGKMGIDATNKIFPETNRKWGKKIVADADVERLVSGKWGSYGI